MATKESPGPGLAAPSATQPLRILLVEDSLADAEVTGAVLRAAIADSELQHCSSALEALKTSLESVDCVLLDYRLADSSGLDVLRSIRQAGHDTPIVVLTGSGSERVAVEALQAGAEDYLLKETLNPTELRTTISNAIEKVELSRRARLAESELRHFAAVAAHDLKAPLRSIGLQIQFILDDHGAALPPPLVEDLEGVRTVSGRMHDLVEGLLRYTVAGRNDDSFGPVELSEAVAEAIENLSAPLQETGSVVTTEALPTIRGDRFALVQLFQNLIANAIKYRSPERPSEVSVSSVQASDGWTIRVADNGIGIEDKNLERVLLPFERLHASSKLEGCGLGLATCQRIVNQHGGTIRIESEFGQGTSVLVHLPTSLRIPGGSTP